MDKIFDMTDKVAVITGGSRGLGREMAIAFAEHGATVVVASRKAETCEDLAREIEKTTGRKAFGLGCHVGHWDECTKLAEEVWKRFGRIDVLVNNAGKSPLYRTLGEISEDLYDKVLDLNLKGPFHLSVLVGERMIVGNGGVIINVSSVAAVSPSPVEVPYGLAKAGLNNLTVALARAFAPKVRVNCIMPGPFMTDISKAWDMKAFEETAKRDIPMHRGGEPNEIVGAALYLASGASTYTTGSILKIDGGASRMVGGG